jgi:hypothetical protein
MSHKATIKMKINDRATLCQTLDSLGVQYQVADNVNGLKITSRYGVQANVDVLLKKDVNGSNMQAVGFKRNEDGTYEAVGDFYEISGAKTKDGERLDQNSFKDAIGKRYTYYKAINQLTQLNFSMGQDVANFKDNELQFTMNSAY